MPNQSTKPLIEAAFGRTPTRTPVWFLRQAGRYLPEYQAIRSKVSFLELCQTPKLAAEVTLQPLKRFDLDAAIIFCDILIPPIGMGQKLSFTKGHGPLLEPAIRSGKDVAKLTKPDCAATFSWLGEAIALTKSQLQPEQTMIGFAGAPFTVASYMIEGQGSRNYTETKTLLLQEPEAFAALINNLAEVTVDYLSLQVAAGADALVLFDTWAGNLTTDHYRTFIAPAMANLTQAVKAKFPDVALIYYPGQGSELYPELSGNKADVIAVDWRVDLARAIQKLADNHLNVSVQGNLDPQILMAPHEQIQESVEAIWRKGKNARGHIFNVGHGLLPHLDPSKLHHVVEYIRTLDTQ